MSNLGPHRPDDRASSPTFSDLFGRPPAIAQSAHGRVNLIGEHTDYNGGYVLPTLIPQQTTVLMAPRTDGLVRAWSEVIGERPGQYRIGTERRTESWIDYVQAITWVLGQAGHSVPGADVRIDSTVPLGSGLSSSAALEIALLRAWREAATLDLDDVSMARLGQRAENGFVEAPCGIMDQMACTLAGDGDALFLDTRSLEFERVALPPECELVVINSGVSHRIGGGDYATRRRECEEAASIIGVPQLRDIGIDDLDGVIAMLPDVLGRRTRHVITEDERVLEAVRAMRAGDAPALGRLFYASHVSMRDDYQVSVPEIDLLVELAREDARVFGARLTGGGFGGSIVALARAGSASDVAARIVRAYNARSAQQATVLVPPPR